MLIDKFPFPRCEVISRRLILGIRHIPPELAEILSQFLVFENIATMGIRQIPQDTHLLRIILHL